ncbi:MAG: hypothetical protein HC940_10490 [Acaryochloris sp. SU_5_25]|nr:hypothetical protein [Acaryochloris sp. SU_5_25]
METPTLTTQISTKELRFQPGGQPVLFEVKVINTSEQFATFQVKVVAAGVETTAGDYWYRLSPEVSAKTPPGDATSFSITILNTPNPGFVGTMNLFVQIHCLELRQEARELLRLKLEPSSTPIPLKLDLGNRSLTVRSSESLDIPVSVANLSPFPVEALLRCTGLDPSWLPEGSERRVSLRARGQGQTQFFCQIPPPSQGASGIYPFAIEALQQGNTVSQAEGVIQLMPGGVIEFSITPREQQIPEKRGWWPNWRANTASYSLLLTNEGNLRQRITAEGTPEPDQPQGKLQVEPAQMDLEIGTTAEMTLWIKHKRPWWGRAKWCAYEVKAVVLSEPTLPIHKDTHRVKLRLQPLLPLWMQGIGTLALLWLLWWLSWLNPNNPFWGHRDAVNSVRFNGVGDDLISGSSDKSMIAWRVDGFFNPFLNQQVGKIGTTGDRAVRVLRYRPVNNDRVAVGLENGEIQIWSALPGNKAPIQTFFAQKDDRVLDLAFSQDARLLFSAHGSGTVVQWNLDPEGVSSTSTPRMVRKTNVGFPLYGIAWWVIQRLTWRSQADIIGLPSLILKPISCGMYPSSRGVNWTIFSA